MKTLLLIRVRPNRSFVFVFKGGCMKLERRVPVLLEMIGSYIGTLVQELAEEPRSLNTKGARPNGMFRGLALLMKVIF